MRALNSHRGFTLIEILLVVSILALVVTMGLGHFAVGIEHGRLEGTASELRSLDARARLLARAEGSIEMRVIDSPRSSGQTNSEVIAARVADGEILTRVILPNGTTLSWHPWAGPVVGVDPNPLTVVAINREGESMDVAWSIAEGTQDAAWVVLGLSGEFVENVKAEATE